MSDQALTDDETTALAEENRVRFDDATFAANGNQVLICRDGGCGGVAECEDEGSAAVIAEALDLWVNRLPHIIGILKVLKAIDQRDDVTMSEVAAIAHAGLDLATNDKEALAEGLLWAPGEDEA